MAKESRETRQRSWKTHTVFVGGSVEAPEPDDCWHPRARQWYDALCCSAPALEYEPSDWATALVAADLLSYLCTASRASAQHWGEFGRMANDLYATPDARRKAKMDVAGRDEDEDADLTDIARWRQTHGL